MKYNILSLGILFLLAATMGACIDDQGNYDYRKEGEVMPAVISGLESKYTFQLGSTNELTANVEGVGGVENLRYMWYVYGQQKNKRDTLGYGKKLNFKVDWESGKYVLWFEVRDTIRDVCVDHKMEVTVESFLSTAWLVMESTDGMTDVDVVASDGLLKENLLTSNGQPRLKGSPVKMAYTSEHEQEEEKGDGTVEVVAKKAFYLLSEKEMRVYNAENMELLKTAEDCFYESPAVIEPMDCNIDGWDAQLINDGKYYYLSGSSANVGKFGYAKLGPDGTTGYDLYGGTLIASQSAMVWDKKSRSFLYVYAYNAQLSYFNEQVAGKEDFGSVTGMDVELKHLLYRSQVYNATVYAYITMGYAIMEELGNYYIADIAFNKQNDYPLQGWYKLQADCKIIRSEVLGAHQTTASIFFASGDELWIHDIKDLADASLRERKLFTFTGEKIACIRHIKIEGDLDGLVVLTSTAGEWKLYAFPFIGGGNEFDTAVQAEDVFIGKGKGEANSFVRMYQGWSY